MCLKIYVRKQVFQYMIKMDRKYTYRTKSFNQVCNILHSPLYTDLYRSLLKNNCWSNISIQIQMFTCTFLYWIKRKIPIRHQWSFQDFVIMSEYVSYNSLLHFLYAIIVIWKKMSFYSKFQNQLYENIQS